MNLSVPYFSQTTKLPNGPPIEDPLGCWYACAKMIGMYWDGNPYRIGVPQLNKDDGTHHLLAPGMEWPLSKNEKWTLDFEQDFSAIGVVEATLKKMGPIYFTMTLKTNDPQRGVSHAGVIVGTSGNNILYHDPAVGPNRPGDLPWLKATRRGIGPTSLYARDPASRPRRGRGWEYIEKTMRS
jgi:hypothetical protein